MRRNHDRLELKVRGRARFIAKKAARDERPPLPEKSRPDLPGWLGSNMADPWLFVLLVVALVALLPGLPDVLSDAVEFFSKWFRPDW